MSEATVTSRAITYRTPGIKHGPITRLMSPGDLGQILKPAVFLDLFDFRPSGGHGSFGMHPHSGIATLTYMISGRFAYEDTTGKSGVLPPGGLEWMRAGAGVWHSASVVDDSNVMGFQLWVALPESEELAPAESLYLDPSQLTQEGPAQVLLGRYGAARSAIPTASSLTYLAVTLKHGERWCFSPPAGHTIAWVAVAKGAVDAGGEAVAGELVAFEASCEDITFTARGDTTFVLGSSENHPHKLVLGNYSVHTSDEALAKGEAEIRRIRATLR